MSYLVRLLNKLLIECIVVIFVLVVGCGSLGINPTKAIGEIKNGFNILNQFKDLGNNSNLDQIDQLGQY